MKRNLSILALIAIALFPPADYVTPATGPHSVGDVTLAGNPELRTARGFTFISEIGGQVQIRYAQWLTEFLIAGAVIAVIVATCRPPADE